MSQTKARSLYESICNQVLGFILSVLLFQYIVGPYLLDIQPNWLDNINITIIFTLVSIVRGYFVRRFFNRFGG